MTHAILGAGGVGGFVGAVLAAAGERVTLLLRAESLADYPGELSLESPLGNLTAPAATALALSHEVDILWIATKATHLEAALGAVPDPGPRPGPKGIMTPRPSRCPGIVLALVAAACGGEPRGPDLVLTNARVVTLDSLDRELGAVAIGGGRIVALADSVDPAWLRFNPQVIDLGRAVVAPAFTDHHVHLFNLGMALLNQRDRGRLAIDLSAAGSLAEIDSLVRARAAGLPKGAWILGTGWSQALWGSQALPTAERLTRAAPDHPVFLARTDGHAGWLNAAGLGEGGITRETADPEGGRIVRLPSGEASGVLLERANELLTSRIPSPGDSDVVTAFRLAAEALAARGVVEVFDAGPLLYPGVVALNLDFGRYRSLLLRADSSRPLPIRINLMIPAPSRLADSLLGSTGALELSPRVRITHLKLFADGALGSRGASLTHRYADDTTTRGVPRMERAGITALGRRAIDRGLGVATHAIGDEAVSRTLDAYEAIFRERPGLDPGRLRIEHFSYAREGDFGRAARLGVALSVQSNFNSAPGDHPSFGALRVGASNEVRVYNWERLLALGARLVEGSDYFGMPGPPLAGFRATLERKYAVGHGMADPAARRLAYRMNAERLEPGGGRAGGRIAVGEGADLVVWAGDPFSTRRDLLDGITVKMLIGSGRVRFPSPGQKGVYSGGFTPLTRR